MKTVRVALAQINPTVGDFNGNVKLAGEAIRKARAAGASLVVFPELTTTGYPPEDLLFKKEFITHNLKALQAIARLAKGVTAAVGYVERDKNGGLFNAAALVRDGKVLLNYRKMRLPNYGVFDERRYFGYGQEAVAAEAGGLTIGMTVCEDIWTGDHPVYDASYRGTGGVLLNLSASPYHAGKQAFRRKLLKNLARKTGSTVVYVNLVGGQDELVFDGGSMVVDASGMILREAKHFSEDLVILDVPVAPKKAGIATGEGVRSVRLQPRAISVKTGKPSAKVFFKPPAFEEEVYRALVLGTRDYIAKNGFRKAVIGLSGGIDSALVAAIAVDALGASNVVGVTMPSDYNSPETVSDARLLADNLGIEFLELPIRDVFSGYLRALRRPFEDTESGAAEENLQARIRGNYLMALSNKFGWLVLTTGNKSEMATGYCTLYGDMAGGFAVIKDVPKTLVFKLARYRNKTGPGRPIPPSTIKRAPSAELRHNQKDQDSLPPYPVLDRFLELYVEKDHSVTDIGKNKTLKAIAAKTAKLVDANEYKRRQAPPGIKITPKAFGRDRRMPLTSRFRPF